MKKGLTRHWADLADTLGPERLDFARRDGRMFTIETTSAAEPAS